MYTFRRAGDTCTCEARSASQGRGYELVITEGRRARVEQFLDVRSLELRQHQLRHAWLMRGWRTAEPGGDLDAQDE